MAETANVEKKPAKKTRRRRSEGERAQDTYNGLVEKIQRKNDQRAKLTREVEGVDAELAELTASRDFWAGHPAVTPVSDTVGEETADNVGIA